MIESDMDFIGNFISKLANTETSNKLFNPFVDICPIHDKKNAPLIRQRNLQLLLEAHMKLKTKMIWLFEAPSYLGARRSGAPFVNEGMFTEIEQILQTSRKFEKATHTDSKTAITTRITWRVAKELALKPLIWEALPFHPHNLDQPLSNRKPSLEEMASYKHFLIQILEIFNPIDILAIGRVAENGLNSLGVKATYVRHPAQGGAKIFRDQIIHLHG